MTTTIDQSFIDHFQADVHQAYQRMGSKLRNTVRVKNAIKGATTVFQKVGKGTATTKARHGKVPVMNVDHEAVRVTCVITMPVIGLMPLTSLKSTMMKRWFWPMPGPMRWAARLTS